MWSSHLKNDIPFSQIFKQKIKSYKKKSNQPTSIPSTYFYPNHSYDWTKIEADILYLCKLIESKTDISSQSYSFYTMSIDPNEYKPLPSINNNDPELLLQYYNSCLENCTSESYYQTKPTVLLQPVKINAQTLLPITLYLWILLLSILIGYAIEDKKYKTIYIIVFTLLLTYLTIRSFQNSIFY
jgi:hypothetical protein